MEWIREKHLQSIAYGHYLKQLGSSYGQGFIQSVLSGNASIARALVRRPDVLVLDDSFSALDFLTDARLRTALRSEAAGCTLFIVAQRISTVIGADRIVVLDEGQVAGVGTHAQLLVSCPVYREIVESQVNLEEVA